MSDGFFDRLFHPRARDIAAVDGPTRVELACRVASPDVVVSSVTGMEAALVRWSLLEERTVHPDRGGGAERGYRVLERGLYGDGAVLVAFAGQAIEVPLETARLVLVEDPEDGDLLLAVPPALRPAVARAATNRALAYRESYLRQGAFVTLVATIERVRGDGAPGYREAASAGPSLRALTEDRIVIREDGFGLA
ncbi:MAG: hypothetical protein H6719_09685 [Sandaracinaceae bacterium]|nr:hypothetical protein [Sandaracinaceae bacterium]